MSTGKERVLNVNGQLINNLYFVDDIVIISKDLDELKVWQKSDKKKAHT